MRIKVKINGHQYYREVVGGVILFSQGIEKIEGKTMQVPCVVIKREDNNQIETVNLQMRLNWTEVEVLPPSEAESVSE